tara:strand:- start:1992 stop:2444 length:453 start_codon:yes stop_codon:yes gene_type:complete
MTKIYTKELTKHKFTKKQFDLYKEFSYGKDYYLKVYEHINDYKYTTEYLDAKKIDWNITCSCTSPIAETYFKIMIDCLQFSKKLPDGQWWVNRDLHLNNFLQRPDGSIVLVDVDAFQIDGSPYHHRQLGSIAQIIMLGCECATCNCTGRK